MPKTRTIDKIKHAKNTDKSNKSEIIIKNNLSKSNKNKISNAQDIEINK